ncbi:hypothetical protein DCAR_0311205 [Daucus carota subsp. sativus]|uniref:C2H2-type domain-containing protein n=1 Tax=Daucus carota subsp. sativus TaxID=79200 RepID=A0A162AHK4_DAUCS|nr:PREDICTED: uncharacterized protein LOC108211613 isoform X2 [Daucus carota subsp. sativus]WOG91950.1 hypothetical protein DCAR_0311205 [Daucus carota subsp. sativus]
MALLTSTPETKKQKPSSKRRKHQSSWNQIKNLLTCKQIQTSTSVHDPSKTNMNTITGAYLKLGHCKSMCSFKDVVHGNTRVVHRPDHSPENSSVGQETGLLGHKNHGVSLSSSSRSLASNASVRSNGGSFSASSRGMQLRKLSGCYECHMIVDPTRYSIPRTTICGCSECGEIFPNTESLELHQAVKHAVSELGPEDSGRNIVEIIFKSSWLKKDSPYCNIERILKVRNTKRTIQRFEDCRDAVKLRATSHTRKNPRCAADGNELLRFHCTSLTCTLGARGGSTLCGALPGCGVCTIIRHGFRGTCFGEGQSGVHTTASSGRAHDCLGGSEMRRAMLVCRVIAGKVKTAAEDDGVAAASYDSFVGKAGVYSSTEELYVCNPKAILPCFVVIYKALI